MLKSLAFDFGNSPKHQCDLWSPGTLSETPCVLVKIRHLAGQNTWNTWAGKKTHNKCRETIFSDQCGCHCPGICWSLWPLTQQNKQRKTGQVKISKSQNPVKSCFLNRDSKQKLSRIRPYNPCFKKRRVTHFIPYECCCTFLVGLLPCCFSSTQKNHVQGFWNG